MPTLTTRQGWNFEWLAQPLRRGPYLAWGLGLAAIKYLVEFAIIWATSATSYLPQQFLLPLLSAKSSATAGCPTWVLGFIFFWSYPFLIAALVLTAKRCIDMGQSPWLSLLLLVPFLNLVFIAAFVVWPSATATQLQPRGAIPVGRKATFVRWTKAILLSQLAEASILIVSVLLLHEYGMAMFFATPLVMGVLSGYTVSRERLSLSASLWTSLLSLLIGMGLVLVAGVEGAICLAMAAPLLIATTLLGGWFGHVLAFSVHDKSYTSLAITLPLVLLADWTWDLRQPRQVLTEIEIDASPEDVWQTVVAFPPLREKPGGLFRWGVAYPIQARIDGSGVGAVRYCEFSTGAFVEPITVWNPPERLAFDVTEQPDPMTELSPYRQIHPPHLEGFLRTERGEFRLVRLPDGRTRLEGRTWYSIDMHPVHYWQVWCDQIIHAIHQRVLQHIKVVAEHGVD